MIKHLYGCLEFVAYGGEDSWWPGDALYIEEYPPENIVAAINIDGIGIRDSNAAIAFFGCSEGLVGRLRQSTRWQDPTAMSLPT